LVERRRMEKVKSEREVEKPDDPGILTPKLLTVGGINRLNAIRGDIATVTMTFIGLYY